jgi:hypothetical protein
MNRGVSLLELLLSLFISTVIVLALYTMYALFSKSYRETRESWYCMQSLRSACAQIDADVRQCALLLPRDLMVACSRDSLFIAGSPVTSQYPGLTLHGKAAPPYFSVVKRAGGSFMELDTVDLNGDSAPDYWADLGVITDSGPGVISHDYSRGSPSLSLAVPLMVRAGDRSVPSNHYELRAGGLYRNSQLLAEAITAFNARFSGGELTVSLMAGHHGAKKDVTFTYRLQ